MEGGELFRRIQERGDQAFTERGTDPHIKHIHSFNSIDEKTVNTSQLLILYFCFFLFHPFTPQNEQKPRK